MAENLNLAEVLEDVKEAARAAGALLREAYDRPRDISYKGEVNLVTGADLAAEELIITTLGKKYPEIGVLAEEGGVSGAQGDLRWLIDPMDGTNNFAHALPMFCTSIALRDPDGPLLGVIYEPLRDECFSAIRGQGAMLNDRPCHVSDVPRLKQSMVATGFPYERQTALDNNGAAVSLFLRRAQGVRRMGAAALDLAYVACGRFDGYWEWGTGPWDIAAGVLLVEEAGGRLTTYAGAPVDELQAAGQNLVASNSLIHDEMLAALREIYEYGNDGSFTLKPEFHFPIR